MYSSTLPINNFTSDILQVKYGFSSVQAGNFYGAIYFVCGIALIFVGLLNDRYGHIALTQVLAALFSLVGNMWWSFYPTELC
jgi:hypothetical protein